MKPVPGLVLEDGPAKGRYSVQRAPHYLRAVVHRATGRVDVLDQLHDEPMPGEDVHVYEADGPTFSAEAQRLLGTIICPPPGAVGRYRHRADVDGSTVRGTAEWRAWVHAQPGVEKYYDPTDPASVRDALAAAMERRSR